MTTPLAIVTDAIACGGTDGDNGETIARNAIQNLEDAGYEISGPSMTVTEASEFDPFLEAARVVGQVYQGCGDTVDAHRMLGLMIMVEHFISGGGDAAGEKMGWEVRKREATVTALEAVRNLAANTKPPQDR